jgi:YVTN family beta-propeller protein/autotransporter-associated beta strand protein
MLAAAALALGVAALAHAEVTAYAFVPTSSSAGGKVVVLRAYNGNFLQAIPIGGQGYDAAVTPDGRRVLVTQPLSNTVTILDAEFLTVFATIPVEAGPRGVAITPDGTRAYVTESTAGKVAMIDLATFATTQFTAGSGPAGIAIAPDGQRGYVANINTGRLTAVDLATNMAIASIDVGQGAIEVAIAPDGRMAYVSCSTANTVVPVDLETFTALPPIPVYPSPQDLTVTPDGKKVFVASRTAGVVSVIDTGTLTNVIPPISMVPLTSGVAVTPDGRRLLATYRPSDPLTEIMNVDAATHQRIIQTHLAGGSASRLAIGPQMIVAHGGPVAMGSDKELTTRGFGNDVIFDGGMLRATQGWSTDRRLSIWSSGGAIDTQGHTLEMMGDTIGEGALTKSGAGTLILRGAAAHVTTRVEAGTLVVSGSHAGHIRLDGATATLAGAGTVGDVDAAAGVISPGEDGPGILRARSVGVGPAHTFVMDIGGSVRGVDYDALDASEIVGLNGAALKLRLKGGILSGAQYRIMTNALGTFAGLPEGAVFTVDGVSFSITYAGGPSGRDVVLFAL